MKIIYRLAGLLLISQAAMAQIDSSKTRTELQEVVILGTKAQNNNPITFQNLNKKEIDKQNFGQDLPFLLNLTPSTVVSSDAGTGVGYTGIRIRGTDPSRTNVTINGVPINDAESHGMYWVNMPDMASSSQNIQVQRGVGTSSNGAGAFGASINVQTDVLNTKRYAEVSNTYGSFNTWKHTVKAGTGLLENKWAFDTRLSKLASDGFIDRASSDLKSFFISAARYGEKSIFKINVFSGKEKTYQAWNGISEYILNTGNRTHNDFTYPNQTDNYQQDYYQMFYTYQFNQYIKANIGLHYTYGRGYYEEYREGDNFSTYKLKDTLFLLNNNVVDTITSGNFVRRRWLDNDFYGTVFSFIYDKNKLNLTIGGGLNQYDGRHFGELIWSQYAMGSNINDHFYDGISFKTDFNLYGKASYKLSPKIDGFVDLQYRRIDYKTKGEDLNSGVYIPYDVNLIYNFFNPKAGITYKLKESANVYAYIGIANKEPVRSDIIQASNKSLPKQEQLVNYELGYRKTWKKSALSMNLYYMDYKDQLINTGQLNDVGAANRVNVPSSYRAGIEISSGVQLLQKLKWQATFTYSLNRIKEITEYLSNSDDYSAPQIQVIHKDVSIAYSPSYIGSSLFSYQALKNFEVDLISKYVGKQYLDNTESESRKLNAFFVNDLRFTYGFEVNNLCKSVRIGLQINNILNVKYESNGSTYPGGISSTGVRTDYNYYFPQAGTNFMGNVVLKFW
ncbi:MAG: TonB-dependent receptor [Bacteroidetes bacterium]|nr:TonB-dependent receptor [Bacteroidota bacterium]